MRMRKLRRPVAGLSCLSGLLLLLVVACNQAPNPPLPAPPAETPSPQVPAGIPVTVTTAPLGSSVPLTPAGEVALTWWTLPQVAPANDVPGGAELSAQISAFENAFETHVRVHLKSPAGPGSLLTLLETGHTVAPSILPDLATINIADLRMAYQAGVIQPLGGELLLTLDDDYFPAAAHAGQIDGRWYGVQLNMDVEHLAYNTVQILAAPISWDQLMSSQRPYLFPLGGEAGRLNTTSLLQYLAAGGRIDPNTGNIILEEIPLRRLLVAYRTARAAGVIPAAALTMETPDTAWSAFASGDMPMIDMRAAQYLANRQNMLNLGFAATPTQTGNPPAIEKGWALVMVASDPLRQAVVQAFINWLVSPDNAAAWSRAAGQVPARRSVFALLEPDDPYRNFLRLQLEEAVPFPQGPAVEQTLRIMQRAVHDVVAGSATVDEAIAQALPK